MAIHLNSFSISPAFITEGDNDVEIHFKANLNNVANNPVKAKLSCTTALDIDIDTPEWDINMQAGENDLSFQGLIIGNSVVSTKKRVLFTLRLKDKAGSVSSLGTTIDYRP